jgi:hypothetical protein
MGANADQKWSAARTRKMTRLADQEMSTSQIADALGPSGNVLGDACIQYPLLRKARFLQIVARLMIKKRLQNGLRLRIGVARLRALPPLIGSAKWVRMALKNAYADGSWVAPQPPGKALTAYREQVGEDAVAPLRFFRTGAIPANGLSSASAGLPWAGSGAITGLPEATLCRVAAWPGRPRTRGAMPPASPASRTRMGWRSRQNGRTPRRRAQPAGLSISARHHRPVTSDG